MATGRNGTIIFGDGQVVKVKNWDILPEVMGHVPLPPVSPIVFDDRLITGALLHGEMMPQSSAKTSENIARALEAFAIRRSEVRPGVFQRTEIVQAQPDSPSEVKPLPPLDPKRKITIRPQA